MPEERTRIARLESLATAQAVTAIDHDIATLGITCGCVLMNKDIADHDVANEAVNDSIL